MSSSSQQPSSSSSDVSRQSSTKLIKPQEFILMDSKIINFIIFESSKEINLIFENSNTTNYINNYMNNFDNIIYYKAFISKTLRSDPIKKIASEKKLIIQDLHNLIERSGYFIYFENYNQIFIFLYKSDFFEKFEFLKNKFFNIQQKEEENLKSKYINLYFTKNVDLVNEKSLIDNVIINNREKIIDNIESIFLSYIDRQKKNNIVSTNFKETILSFIENPNSKVEINTFYCYFFTKYFAFQNNPSYEYISWKNISLKPYTEIRLYDLNENFFHLITLDLPNLNQSINTVLSTTKYDRIKGFETSFPELQSEITNLNEIISRNNSEIQELQNRIELYNEDNIQKSYQNQNLVKLLEEKEKENKKYVEELQNIREELQNYRENIQNLKSKEIQKIKEDYDLDLENLNKQHSEQINELNVKIKSLENESESIRSEIIKLLININELNQEKKKILESSERYKTLLEKEKQMKEELQVLLNEMENTNKRNVLQINELSNNFNQKIEELNQKYEKCQKELQFEKQTSSKPKPKTKKTVESNFDMLIQSLRQEDMDNQNLIKNRISLIEKNDQSKLDELLSKYLSYIPQSNNQSLIIAETERIELAREFAKEKNQPTPIQEIVPINNTSVIIEDLKTLDQSNIASIHRKLKENEHRDFESLNKILSSI